MRFAISISKLLRPLFAVFGFSTKHSWVELGDQALTISYGTAHEVIPLSEVASVRAGKWPFYYGLGAKLTPRDGVGYVGSFQGIVEIQLKAPRRINVWGPFTREQARHVTLSLVDADGFIQAFAKRGGS